MLDQKIDTICAVATPIGYSAIGVVKLSGKSAIDIVNRLFRARSHSKDLLSLPSRTVCYGWIVDPETQEVIDDVVVVVYRAPHSYTGENVVEISTHGSPLILSELLKLLCTNGARLAEPGEYTRRAFSNGKMDLSQAEAVADVIASTNKASLRMSMTQMRGGYGMRIRTLREPLLQLCALLELELDFGEEEVEFADRGDLMRQCVRVQKEIDDLLASYQRGEVIKKGIPIALVGATNAGKSTLLNAFLQEERAIVSEIHGTTRDTIQDTIVIAGKEFRVIDTAGIRETTDEIESIGISRSYDEIAKSSLVIWIIDASSKESNNAPVGRQILSHTEKKRVLPLLNKIDVADPISVEKLYNSLLQDGWQHPVKICAKKQEDVEMLKECIANEFDRFDVQEGDIIVSNLRHAQALQKASDSLFSVQEGLQQELPSDLVAQDLRAAIHSLSEIVGEINTEDILQHIFQHFCIGK